MSANRKNDKPRLEPIEGNRDLYAFVNLERNPAEKKAGLHAELAEASQSKSNPMHKNDD